MSRKRRLMVGLAVMAALVVLIVPAAAMADEDDPYYDGGGWCHSSGYGGTALSDRATLNRVGSTVGLTAAKLQSRLRDGDTVADIAAQKDVDLQNVVDAALVRHRNLLQWQVEDGAISQGRADSILNRMRDELTTAFEEGYGTGYGFGGYMGGMMGGFGGWGHMGGFGRGGWGW